MELGSAYQSQQRSVDFDIEITGNHSIEINNSDGVRPRLFIIALDFYAC